MSLGRSPGTGRGLSALPGSEQPQGWHFPALSPLVHLVSFLSPQQEQTWPKETFARLRAASHAPVPQGTCEARGAAAPAVINHWCKRPIGAINNYRHLLIGIWIGSSKAARPPLETHLSWAEITNLFSPGHCWPAQRPHEAASHLWGPDVVYLTMLWARGEKGEGRSINFQLP